MRATWYDLDDGSVVDPNECAPDAKGALMHKSGVAVKMRGDVPSSRGVDTDDLPKPAPTPAPPPSPAPTPAPPAKDPVKARVTKPAPSKKFKTR